MEVSVSEEMSQIRQQSHSSGMLVARAKKAKLATSKVHVRSFHTSLKTPQ
jgi:hypothetical protein